MASHMLAQRVVYSTDAQDYFARVLSTLLQAEGRLVLAHLLRKFGHSQPQSPQELVFLADTIFVATCFIPET